MLGFLAKFLVSPATGDQGISPIVIIAAVVAIILVSFLILWPKFSKKDDEQQEDENVDLTDIGNGNDDNSDQN